MEKVFLEIDEYKQSEIDTFSKLFDEKFDWDIIEDAGSQSQLTWEAVKSHDKIYMNTALINSYFGIGSGNLFNNMMYQAQKEGVTGKKLYIFRDFKSIQWCNLNYKLVDDVLRKNEVYTLGEHKKGYEWVLASVDKILEDI